MWVIACVHQFKFHAIWDCLVLNQVWDLAFNWVRKDFPHSCSVLDLVQVVGQHPRKLELFSSVAWFVWSYRNKIRLKEPSLPVGRIFESANMYLFDFQQNSPTPNVKKPLVTVKLKPSVVGNFKTNYDGVVFEDIGEARIGVIVCRNGNMLGSRRVSLCPNLLRRPALVTRIRPV